MEKHLVQVLRNRAARYADREAFRFRPVESKVYQSTTWREFASLVDEVAHSLLSLGFGAKSNIGIFSANRPEWTIADYGIMAVRGVVVPFFSTASKSQVKYIVDETSMTLMFVGNKEQLDAAVWLMDQHSTLSKVVSFDETAIDGKDERLMRWSDFLALGKQKSSSNDLDQILTQAEEDDLATIIYTSGTTGEPKGVMLGQDNFISCLQIHDQRLDVNDTDVSMCFLPLSHIF